MKKLLILYGFVFIISCSNRPQSCQMGEFEWLTGAWERYNIPVGSATHEYWEANNESLTGKGVSLKNGDTTYVERLKIEKREDIFYYVVDIPEHPEPVLFKISIDGDQSFTATNPENEFPKKIYYELKEEGQLFVEISAGDQRITFDFKKKE